VRGSDELASPVDVERSSFIFKAMGKRSKSNCDKNGCKCKKQRKAVTLEEKLSVIHFTRLSCYAMISRNELIACNEGLLYNYMFHDTLTYFKPQGVIFNVILARSQIYEKFRHVCLIAHSPLEGFSGQSIFEYRFKIC
jgi:hypothetical protein